ncbi:MAG TPA: hypothetical protein VJR70_11915 [Stellaceae bacterium]|nr:hypothetical protein [Stellaceae bacterium]
MTGTDIAPVLTALDRALADKPEHVYDDLVEAQRRLAALRNRLIAQRRDGADAGAALRRVNAALSLVVAGEYPLVGLRRQRIEQAREVLVQPG